MARRWVAGLLGLAGLVGLVGVVGWQTPWRAPSAGEPAAVAPGGRSTAAVASAPPARGAHARGAAAAASAAGALPSGAPIPAEGVQICGIGRMPADVIRRALDEPDALDPRWEREQAVLVQRGEAALARMAARLSSGADRQQVAARLLMGDVNGAALLAVPSADPVAYQMALSACGPWPARPEAPNCGRLSAEHWAAMDPADARPWLRLLDAAQRKRDEAGVDAALAQVAARTTLSRGAWLLEAQLASVAATETDDAARGHALIKAIGIDAGMVSYGLSSVMKACDSAHPAHARRLPLCRAAASQLLAASSNFMEAIQAQKLADRTGVPKSAQAYDAATLKAASDALGEQSLADVGLDCASMVKMTRLSRERAEQGELAQALALLAKPKPR